MQQRSLAGISLALTLGGASLLAAQAATPAAAPPATAATAAQPAPPAGRDMARHHRGARRLFHGVKLTPDQHAKLTAIREQYRTQAKPLIQQLRSERVALRDARTRADTAAESAARSKIQDARNQLRTMREHWTTDARAILTPAQQVQFDKNLAAMKARWQRHHGQSQARS